jgi:hypothetical protein
MAQSGLNSGMSRGMHQGVKSGLAMSTMNSGMNSGVISSIWDKSKIQNPANLSGVKKPLIFNCADNIGSTSGTSITLTDLSSSGFTLTNNQGSSSTPDIIENGIFGTRDYLDFNNNACSLFPTPSLNFSGDSELSFMMVVRIKANSNNQVLFVSNSITPGGVDVSTIDSNRTLRSIFYGGQAGAITDSRYDTFLSQEEASDWMILTLKYRLKLPNGAGSEQEMYVNGRLQKKLFSSNFSVITTAMTSGQTFIVGNTTTSAGSRGQAIQLGSFLLFDYWLNESEQLRLENYFRWYYGNSF